ncbi:peptide-methionine (R)-S-oxide reductase MsrB [Sphingomonas sp. AP4-R1]|uniref:peptide-methionine (R)-S-oxide reductase MsrB n=1 Tax=Sphingomonas sp. AP4-R1 TaxID=2735134 RepID=UPI001C10BC4D|nr:peptide-methionine (R)-S-oxide reductase MsrB [Sphingomonas sp. AP4-R1]
MRVSRREAIGAMGMASAVALLWTSQGGAAETRYELTLSDAEWRKRLSGPSYSVLRKAATEAPYSSPLNSEHRAGIFSCAGCALPLFSSKTKFDSHTGWPSFYAPLAKAVLVTSDYTIGMERTEVHCRRCGGHLGHVFDDGPPPTGKRYCMNGLAMTFAPGKA